MRILRLLHIYMVCLLLTCCSTNPTTIEVDRVKFDSIQMELRMYRVQESVRNVQQHHNQMIIKPKTLTE